MPVLHCPRVAKASNALRATKNVSFPPVWIHLRCDDTDFVLCLLAASEEEGATPVKRRRVSSDDEDDEPAGTSAAGPPPSCGPPPCPESSKPDRQGALTPPSTSDTETRDSLSLIDPGTEQDPPSPPVAASPSPKANQMAEREEPDRRATEPRAPPLPEDAALPPEEGPEDVLDVLCRTLEAAVAMVTKLTMRALPSS